MITLSDKLAFIKRTFGSYLIDRTGINVAVRCPSCSDDQKKKLSINIDTWQAHCWVCGLKGKTLLPILKRHCDISDYRDFQHKFLQLSAEVKEPIVDDLKVLLPDGFILLADHICDKDPDIRACFSYLRSRGVRERDLWYYKMGTSRTGRYRRSIIIPSFDVEGQLNYFVTRKIDEDKRFKYINAKADKKKIVFNEINIDWSCELTIVEGPFDLIKSNDNSTCLLGSNLTSEMFLFKMITSHKTPVLLALDSDMRKKSFAIADILMSYDCDVRILELGKREDVGEMSREEFEHARRDAVMWDRQISLLEKISEISSGSII